MIIRPLKETDIPQLLGIYNPYIESTCFTLEEEPLTLKAFTERTKRIAAKYPYLVGEENGEILGYVYLDLFHERSAYSISCDLSLYIKMGKTHQGLGQALWEAILPLSKQEGYENIISLVTSLNPHSIAFHEKNGFLLEGRLKNVARKHGQTIDTLFYRYSVK